MFALLPWKRARRPGSFLPRSEFPLVPKDFEAVVNRFFGDWPMVNRIFGDWPVVPIEPFVDLEPYAIETEELEKEIVIRVPVPGFELPELNVEVHGDMLSVLAEHKEPEPVKGEAKAAPIPETVRSRVYRTFTVPPGTDPGRMEARYRNGILELHLPRTEEAKPRRIEVKV
jgi:HSP20 family protein